MDIKELLNFLSAVKKNNNREWYLENKEIFDRVKLTTRELAQNLLNEIATFEPDASYLTPADCTYRIYRDVRFSNDKSPYKTHIGIFINPPQGKKSLRMGYYLHLEPRKCFLAAGNIGFPPKLLANVRKAIYDNVDEYLEIINEPEFKRLFPVVGENPVKTAPKGFSREWEHIELVKPRDFIVSLPVKDSEAGKPQFLKKAAEIFRVTKPFNDFINYTVDEYSE